MQARCFFALRTQLRFLQPLKNHFAMFTQKGLVLLSTALLIGVLLMGVHTYGLRSERNDFAKRNRQLEQEVSDLGVLNSYYQQQLDSLESNYDDLVKANAEAQLKMLEQKNTKRSRKPRS